MRKGISLVGVMLLSFASSAFAESSATLRGSRDSMLRQHQIAQQQEFTFIRTPSQVERFVDEGYLERVEGNDDYSLANVSFPFARPALRTFVERLGSQYREACGEKLVVTSLTRPQSLQPSNAHQLSVHPAGMAVDLRISEDASCREWLEQTLLSLEKREILDITRERNPPHYHVAVFPEAYLAHFDQVVSDSVKLAEAQAEAEATSAAASEAALAASASALRPASSALVKQNRDRQDQPWLVFGAIVVAGALAIRRRQQPQVSSEETD